MIEYSSGKDTLLVPIHLVFGMARITSLVETLLRFHLLGPSFYHDNDNTVIGKGRLANN